MREAAAIVFRLLLCRSFHLIHRIHDALMFIQHFDNGTITNGVFLGHLASMKFIGSYEIKKVKAM